MDRFKENTIWNLTHGEKELGGVVHLVRKYIPLFFLLFQSKSRYCIEIVVLMVDQAVTLIFYSRLLSFWTFPYSFIQDGGNWVTSHVPKFSAMDPTYRLPDNVAFITLQVCPS
jgi:hypothetical protein